MFIEQISENLKRLEKEDLLRAVRLTGLGILNWFSIQIFYATEIFYDQRGKQRKSKCGKKMSQELLAPLLPSPSPLLVALRHPLKPSGFL